MIERLVILTLEVAGLCVAAIAILVTVLIYLGVGYLVWEVLKAL